MEVESSQIFAKNRVCAFEYCVQKKEREEFPLNNNKLRLFIYIVILKRVPPLFPWLLIYFTLLLEIVFILLTN